MKRILIFGISSVHGGVETVILNYGKELAEQGYKLDFVLINEIPQFLKDEFGSQSNYFVVPYIMNNPIKYWKTLKKIIKENQYDVLWYHVNTLIDISLLKLSKKAGIPVRIIHAHNSKFMGRKWLLPLHIFNKYRLCQYATHYLACSDVAKDFMYFKKDLKSHKSMILKNAIHIMAYRYDIRKRKEFRREYGVEDAFVIGHVGRFSTQKNHSFLLDIFKEISSMEENAILLLIGEGELESLIKEKASTLNLDDRIRFIKKTNQVSMFYQGMDAFMLPSLYEGLPMVGVEAQASGLPCFFSDQVSKETKITSNAYFYALDDNPKEWAEKILRVSEDFIRKDTSIEIEDAGFDIRKNVKLLLEFMN